MGCVAFTLAKTGQLTLAQLMERRILQGAIQSPLGDVKCSHSMAHVAGNQGTFCQTSSVHAEMEVVVLPYSPGLYQLASSCIN